MKKLISFLVTSIVDNPDKVDINESHNETSDFTTYILSVAQEDMGRIIGKKGKIIRALRNLVHVAAIKQGKKVILALKEDQRDLPSQS
jgi:hypothetical protein